MSKKLSFQRTSQQEILEIPKDFAGGTIRHICKASPNIILHALPHSSAVVFLTLQGPATLCIEATVAPFSHLTIVCLGGGTLILPIDITQMGSIDHDGHLHWINVSLGQEGSQTLISTVTGARGRSDIDWAFFATGEAKQTFSARNVFSAEESSGEILLRGVAQEKARVTIDGMIEIAEGGVRTNTYLTEDVLMLDPTARIDAAPALEIKTNDVKASHSASIRRVTPEDLFYFQSRGIDPDSAKRMLTEGFLGSVLERIPGGDVRASIIQEIEHVILAMAISQT